MSRPLRNSLFALAALTLFGLGTARLVAADEPVKGPSSAKAPASAKTADAATPKSDGSAKPDSSKADGATSKASEEEGARHFVEIAKVLQSPRCKNCHPSGDAPLHGDTGSAHSMNVSRKSPEAGLKCTTCHRSENQEEAHAPPGVPGWHMPSAETPMVFEGLPAKDLCDRLKDTQKNGGRTPEKLRDHMDHDPLVLWAWSPGPGRSVPPMTHDALMTHVKAWVDAGAPCPK